MKKKLLGFTLGEVLVSMAIIGVVMALASHTIKAVKSSYTSLTYSTLHNVNAMVSELISGNIQAYDENGILLESSILTCKSGSNQYTNVLAPDIYPSTGKFSSSQGCSSIAPSIEGGLSKNLFCRHASYISNTVGAKRCTDDDLLGVVESTDPKIEPKIDGLDDKWETPNFIATNGQRYYISKRMVNDNISTEYGYRIIAVDVNGKQGPNITEYNNDEVLPDIVQFLVLDNGEVYPIGIAASNVDIGTVTKPKAVLYLNTRIKGYNYRNDPTRTENIPENCFINRGNGAKEQVCNYAVFYLQSSASKQFFSYKEALCSAMGGSQITYKNYCYDKEGTAITKLDICPPSNNVKRVDLCETKVIKPTFRYNLK